MRSAPFASVTIKGSRCVKVLNEPGFIIVGSVRYFGRVLVYKALLHCQSADRAPSEAVRGYLIAFKYTMSSLLVNREIVHYYLRIIIIFLQQVNVWIYTIHSDETRTRHRTETRRLQTSRIIPPGHILLF